MDKENRLHIDNGAFFHNKEEWNYVICRKMNGTGYHHVKQDNWAQEEKYVFSFVCGL
jgi:hypothetical protein